MITNVKLPVCQNAKSILYNPTGPGQPVVKNPFRTRHGAGAEGFHEPRPERERIIAHNMVWNGYIITRKWLGCRESQCIRIQCIP